MKLRSAGKVPFARCSSNLEVAVARLYLLKYSFFSSTIKIPIILESLGLAHSDLLKVCLSVYTKYSVIAKIS